MTNDQYTIAESVINPKYALEFSIVAFLLRQAQDDTVMVSLSNQNKALLRNLGLIILAHFKIQPFPLHFFSQQIVVY
jgi:hypothetical protein